MDFFGKFFTERVEEFSREHEENHVRVEVVTLGGQRFDILRIKATDVVTRLYTRDDRMVFLPYHNIAYVDVSILKDQRIVGFQPSTSSE
jgi:hypothetical protein